MSIVLRGPVARGRDRNDPDRGARSQWTAGRVRCAPIDPRDIAEVEVLLARRIGDFGRGDLPPRVPERVIREDHPALQSKCRETAARYTTRSATMANPSQALERYSTTP